MSSYETNIQPIKEAAMVLKDSLSMKDPEFYQVIDNKMKIVSYTKTILRDLTKLNHETSTLLMRNDDVIIRQHPDVKKPNIADKLNLISTIKTPEMQELENKIEKSILKSPYDQKQNDIHMLYEEKIKSHNRLIDQLLTSKLE